MSTVNYEDLYEEFLLLTSSSSSSSPSAGEHSSPPPKQTPSQENSKEQMPDTINFTEQQSQQQRMSVISTAGFPVVTNSTGDQTEIEAMNSQGETQTEDQIDSHCSVMQKEQPGNADELRKLLCAPAMPTPRNHQFRSPFIHQQQYEFPPQHFLAQCSPISPSPSANIAWGQGPSHSQQMSHSPPQNLNYFNQQQFINPHHHQPQHLQQQIIVHQPNQSMNHQMNQQYQHQQQQMMNNINMRSTHWDNQPLPKGVVEVLRSLAPECQKYFTVQDVPESGRFRGYLTVCEQLVLKRTLQGRYSCSVEEQREEKSAAGSLNSVGYSKYSSKKRKRVTEKPEEEQPIEEAELQGNCEVTVTVGVAVKEALDALDEEQQSQSQSNGNSNTAVDIPVQEQSIMLPTSSQMAQTVTNSMNQSSSTQNTLQNPGHGSAALVQRVSMGPPPPYRTAQLVFKLLQIGNYQLRSFAERTPNKFKVLYNTQRIVYECQLPLFLPQGDEMQPQRKLLTIDIGFDQVSFVRFGNDKMFMRVEGAPLLTVTKCAITDDDTSSPVSFQEQQWLDQIDRGLLNLSPCHQVFFLNESKVHMLESQFRDHPRFRHLLFQNPICMNEMQQGNSVNNNLPWNK